MPNRLQVLSRRSGFFKTKKKSNNKKQALLFALWLLLFSLVVRTLPPCTYFICRGSSRQISCCDTAVVNWHGPTLMETSISIDARWTYITALLLPKSSTTVKRRWNSSPDIPTTLTPASVKNGEIKSVNGNRSEEQEFF